MVQHLLENSLRSLQGFALTPFLAFKVIFQAISGGLLFEDEVKINDPCQRELISIFHHLTHQEKEDITASSQVFCL